MREVDEAMSEAYVGTMVDVALVPHAALLIKADATDV